MYSVWPLHFMCHMVKNKWRYFYDFCFLLFALCVWFWYYSNICIGSKKLTFYICENVIIFLSIRLIICSRCSKEPSQWDGSIKYPCFGWEMKNTSNTISYLEAYVLFCQPRVTVTWCLQLLSKTLTCTLHLS